MHRATLAATLLLLVASAGCSRSGTPESTAVPADAAPSPIASLAASIPELPAIALDRATASKLISLSLACVDKPYPYKPDVVLESERSLEPPQSYSPAFYGCFDWHSAVHGHWALVRVLSLYPDLPEAPAIRAALDRHLTSPIIARELAFFQKPGSKTFERPYGWGWFLRLAAELHASPLKEAREWEAAAQPLAIYLSTVMVDYLLRLSAPIRAGTHANTAFSLVHALDYARAVGDARLAFEIEVRARDFFQRDRSCPTGYEPSGEDFISPCLVEADLMRRVLPRAEFLPWLDAFLPTMTSPEFRPLLRPVEVRDRQDPRIGHLIGLSLQRSWCMEGIATTLADTDPRRSLLSRLARLHRQDASRQMFDSGYGGAHWLASFAIYLLSGVGPK
ncbi:MAG: DUF2891 domain-containing protein [Deltaproteobacteria bacterium]|nr:DUF2891 domain-containing protein [Deltaproteobacteria bacterium]